MTTKQMGRTPAGEPVQIRYRSRRGRPPEGGGAYMTWFEWQVVVGRKVVGRWDFEHEAAGAANKLVETKP